MSIPNEVLEFQAGTPLYRLHRANSIKLWRQHFNEFGHGFWELYTATNEELLEIL